MEAEPVGSGTDAPARYEANFFSYTEKMSAYAASTMTCLLRDRLEGIGSVLDVGCALGTWLVAWRQAGVGDHFGVDGSYVDVGDLRIDVGAFSSVDLNEVLDLGRCFDLVQSLEVGEHIRPAASAVFVQSLVRHATRYILFSAATPGQGGENHINERPLEFWRRLFQDHGFVAFDAVRPFIARNKRIAFWYRHNTILYVRGECVASLPPSIRDTRVTGAISDVAPFPFRIRKAAVRMLPHQVQTSIARMKSKLIATRHGNR